MPFFMAYRTSGAASAEQVSCGTIKRLQSLISVTNSPFHDPQNNPLPDANDIEQEATENIELYSLQQDDSRSPSPHIKRDIQRLRNAIIWLLVIGAGLGVALGIVAAIFLKRVGLLDSPTPMPQRTYEQPDIN